METVLGLKHGSHTLGQHRLQEERESSTAQLRAQGEGGGLIETDGVRERRVGGGVGLPGLR